MSKQKCKVCILTSVHNVFDTRVFHKEARSLQKNGYEVVMVAPHDRDEEIDGIKIIPLAKPKNRLRRIFNASFRVFKKALVQDAVIYHFHDPELIFTGVLLRLRGKKVIYDIHEDVVKQIKNKKWVPFKNTAAVIYRMLELIFCRFFSLILAEDSYYSNYPERYSKTVVHNFPELSLFKDIEAEKREESSIVYLGGVTKLRGIDRILEALVLLNKDMEVYFDCIGPISPEYERELIQKVTDLGLADYVRFYGRLDAREAYQLTARNHVGLAVLQPDPNYLESYPTKLFEYMYLKLPVITANFPLYERLIKETGAGLVVDPESVKEIAGAVKFFFNKYNKAVEMGLKGRQAVIEKFNWANEEKKLIDLYKQLENDRH